MPEEKNDNDNGKEVAKRYSYPRAAQCEIDGETREVQILNISASGVQFAARAKIESKNPVRIRWKDSHFGSFEPTFLIAREVHNPDSKEFPFFYGSQYYNLAGEARQNLLLLLKSFVNQDKKDVDEQLGKITPKYLFEVVDQGNPFLQKAFNGEKVPPYFDDIIKEFKDYERHAFGMDDDLSMLIQKISQHGFFCNVIRRATTLMTEKSELRASLFQRTQELFVKINDIEKEVDLFIREISKTEGVSEQEKKFIQKKLNESTNRLFYAKHGLLKAIVETFGDFDLGGGDAREVFKKFRDEFDLIEENIKPDTPQDSHLYKRRTKKPRAEPVVIVPVISEKKPRYILWFGIFFLLLAGGVFGFMRVNEKKNIESMQQQLDIPLTLLSYDREGLQINLVVADDEWQKLPQDKKDEMFKKIMVFLQKDRQARGCVIINEKKKHLKTLLEDMLPTTVAKP